MLLQQKKIKLAPPTSGPKFCLEIKLNSILKEVILEIPEGLAKIANGRDIISTNEAGLATNTSPQTIRKHLCINGHFHGCKPIKIGGRQNLVVSDLAKLIRGVRP